MCFRELDKNRKVKVKLEHHMHILWVQFHPAACLFLTLSALSPPSLFSSPLFPHSYSFPPVIPPLFSSFYFFYFFFSPSHPLIRFDNISFSNETKEGWNLSKQIYMWFVYIPCSTGPASFIRRFLFTVYAMVNLRGRWNDKATWPVSP